MSIIVKYTLKYIKRIIKCIFTLFSIICERNTIVHVIINVGGFMSKIFNSELMRVIVNIDAEDFNTLSDDDKQIYLSIIAKKGRIEARFNNLIEKYNSLDSTQLTEFNELKETLEELNELKAQRLNTEEIQQYIDNMSSREDTMPALGKMWLEALRRIQESRKTR